MRVRTLLLLIGIVGVFAVPVAVADDSKNATVAFAKGNVRWTIPLPNAFGVEVGNHLWFNADKHRRRERHRPDPLRPDRGGRDGQLQAGRHRAWASTTTGPASRSAA